MPETLQEHYGYLADRVKRARYEAAIGDAVQPGDLVLDLGCGSGLLGLMALRAGASKVLFVEEGPIIEVARGAVGEAGLSDRAEFFQSNSFDLSLPERVDVILCDHVGYFGFDYGILALLADAKQRFLKEGGVVIPAEVTVQAALVESGSSRALVGRWREENIPEEFHWVGTASANAKHAVNLEAGHLVSDIADLGTLILRDDADEFITWQSGFNATRDAKLDGVLGCFDACLHGDVSITNSPIADEPLDRPQAFLPLENPVPVKQGDHVDITIMVRPLDHVIAWVVEVAGQRFSLTTFNGLLIDNAALDRGRPDRIAHLNSRGLARQIVLSYCDGKRTVAEVEALVLQTHPDLFPSQQAADAFVRKVLASDTNG
jgi:protein arginine N-methyltransferase 1